MKQRSLKKIAAKEEKRRKHMRSVEIVREAARMALSLIGSRENNSNKDNQ